MAKNNTTWSNNIAKKITNWIRDSKANAPYMYDDPTITFDDNRDFFYDNRIPINEISTENTTVWIQS